jgi:nucleotide-binding universal stress UspA family protein
MTTILVPVDGSPLAERALPLAAALASAGGGRVLFLHAAPARSIEGSFERLDDPSAYLDSLADTLRARGVEVTPLITYIYYWEEAARAIREAVEDQHADLVVMSTHGRGGFGRWLYGSVADLTLRETTVPVLLVPAACDRDWPAAGTPRILVPLDGSELAKEALGVAAGLAETLSAELHLLQVVEPIEYLYAGLYGGPAVYFPDSAEAELKQADAYLEALAAPLRAGGQTVVVHTAIGSAAATIAELARAQAIDLVAMATHGRGGLARLVLGSVATGVLQRAHLPLLLVRPMAMQAALPELPPETKAERAPETAEAAIATITVALTPFELGLVRRALGDLAYLPERDPKLAGPALELLKKLKQTAAVEGAVARAG